MNEIDITPITEITPRMLSWGRNSALFRLNQKDMSEQELFKAIKRKAGSKFVGITEECAETLAQKTIDHCNDLNLLSDVRYAEVKVRSGSLSGKSKRQIAAKLQEKGIDVDTSAVALEEVDDIRSAVVYCRKRGFGPFRRDLEPDAKRINKELSGLVRNGFAFQLAQRTLKLSREEADEILYDRPL